MKVPDTSGKTKIHTTRQLINSVFHIIYSRFSWPRPHWKFCPVITGILFYCREIYLYDHFFCYQFAPLVRSSRIHLHNTSQLFIPNSTLFVGILILTKIGGCWIFYLLFHIFHMQYSIEKISKEIPWIVYRHKFPAISLHFLYRIVNSKLPLWTK